MATTQSQSYGAEITRACAPRATAPGHGGRPLRPKNISSNERVASLAGGSVLVLVGVRRGGLGGLLLSVCGGALAYRGWTGHCRTYAALGLNSRQRPPQTSVRAQQGVRIERSIAVNRSADDLYAFWSDLANLPSVMRHVKKVEVLGDGRSRWNAEGPMRQTLTWEAEIINQREGELIAWRSLPGSQVETAGSVRFDPLGHGRGTAVVVSLKYNPPGGKLAAWAAHLFGEGLEEELDEDLRRFKSAMEAGEAPTIVGQPHGV